MEFTPEQIAFIDAQWGVAVATREHLVASLIRHWEDSLEPCRFPVCCGPAFDNQLEDLDEDGLRAALHASVYHLAQLRTLPGP